MSHPVYDYLAIAVRDVMPPSGEFSGTVADNAHMLRSYERIQPQFKAFVGKEFEGVVLEIGIQDGNQIFLCFSADGKPEYAQQVIELYQLRPDDFPFNVRIFRTPHPQLLADSRQAFQYLDSEGEFQHFDDWDETGVKFVPARNGKKLDCILYYSFESSRKFIDLHSRQLIQNMLGEWPCLALLDQFDLLKLPRQPDRLGIVPLNEVHSAFEQARDALSLPAEPNVN